MGELENPRELFYGEPVFNEGKGSMREGGLVSIAGQ